MAPNIINGWESPKFIAQYNKTIDETELEIRTYESQRKFEGRTEDNRNPNNWLEIFYDHELDKWGYMVPGKLPDASIKRGRIIAQKIKTAEDRMDCISVNRILIYVCKLYEDEETPYNAKWITKFADKNATVSLVRIYCLATLIKTIPCVWVDGCRHLIPMPLLGGENITISAFEYKIGSILNHHLHEFDQTLNQAIIKIQDN